MLWMPLGICPRTAAIPGQSSSLAVFPGAQFFDIDTVADLEHACPPYAAQ